jgi:hypothetical protein
VDARQASELASAWTAMSVRRLAAAGAASLTYFETTGWLGVVERESGSPRPDLFPSRPGEPFPLYRALAHLADLRGEELVATASSDPLTVDALGFHSAVLVANLTPRTQRVAVGAERLDLAPYELARVTRD